MLTPALKNHSRWWTYEDLLLIFLVGALFYIPGLGQVPLFDRDEPRFATAAQNMLRTGDYIIPRFNGQLRPDKPPLVYWEMATSYRLLGVSEFAARLPSALCAILTLWVVYVAAGSRFGRLTGILAALMLSSTCLFIAEARLATADATMILFTTLSLSCAWRAWDAGNPGRRGVLAKPATLTADEPDPTLLEHVAARPGPVPPFVAITFWVSLGLGTLAKGVPLLFVLLPMIALSIATAPVWSNWKNFSTGQRIAHFPEFIFRAIFRGNWSWWRGLRPLTGFLLLLAVAGGWVLAVLLRHDGQALLNGMTQQQVDRVLSKGTIQTYAKPPGFYFALVWVTFWPWTPLLIPAAYHTLKRIRGKTAITFDPRPYQFLLAWIIPSWLVYELIRSKLVHYVLPLYIPLIILCADTLVQSWHRLTDVLAARWFQWARWFFLVVWIALAAALIVTLHLALNRYGILVGLAVPFAGALVAVGVAGAIAWNRPAWPYVTILGFCAALLFGNEILLPQIDELQLTKHAMVDARGWRDNFGFALGAAGYTEPTLVFYSDQPILPLFDSVLDPALTNVFQPGPKTTSKTGKITDTGQAVMLVVNDRALVDLNNAHIHYIRVADYYGFRSDGFDGLKEFFARFTGNPVDKKAPAHLALISNEDPYPKLLTTLPTTAP